jgi:hypothetical protein
MIDWPKRASLFFIAKLLYKTCYKENLTMGWFDAAATYRSGDTPKYKIGDIAYKLVVIMPELNKRKLQKFCMPCEITGVSTKKSGIIFREFTYTVKLGTGEVIENVYESELYTEYQNVPETKNPDITFKEAVEEAMEQMTEDSL